MHAGYAIVIDPYADGKVPGLRPLNVSAHEVLTSHGYDDHNAAGAVGRLAPTSSSPFTVTRVLSAHDVKRGSFRGPNTIHVLEAGGLRVAHLGDLGHLPDAAQ